MSHHLVEREFTSDWVTTNTPNWLKWLSHLIGKPGVKMLEIGSYEGRSACWWCERILTGEGSELTCIDPFGGEYAVRFDPNTEGLPIRKIKGMSRNVVPTLPDNHYDAIYIDGSHEAADCLLDGLLCWRKLKRGGVLIFDDYRWTGEGSKEVRNHVPKPGIDAFLELLDYEFELIQMGYQVAVKRKGNP